MNCPYCGKLTDQRLDSCPHCGGLMTKEPTARIAARESHKQTCPSCHALVQDGDIICVACGTNLLTGQKIVAENRLGPSRPKLSAWMIVAGVVGLVVIVFGTISFFFLFRDPVEVALALSLKGQKLEAIETLNKHLESKPGDARAHLGLGKLEWSSGHFPEAARHFQEVARLEKDNAEALRFALVCMTSDKRAKTTDQEVSVLKGLVGQQRDDFESWYLYGLVQGLNNNVSTQIEALEKSLALNPTDSSIKFQLGVAFALQGDYEKAEEELNSARASQPDNGDILAALGFVVRKLGRNEESLELLSASLATTSARDDLLLDLGLALLESGNYMLANTYLEQAAGPRKRNRVAVFFNAVCMGELGRVDEAIADFKLLSQGQDKYVSKSCVQIAQLYLGMSALDSAREYINMARQSGSQSVVYYAVAGAIEAQAGAYVEAREFLNKAINTDPQYAAAYLEIGLLNVKLQSFAEGLKALERYLQLSGAQSGAPDSLGIDVLVDQLRQTLNNN